MLAIAEKMERIFRLPVVDAPRLFLVGGQIDPASFGTTGTLLPSASATGTGLDLWQAGRACICEGVEFLSQLASVDRHFVVGAANQVPHGMDDEALTTLLGMLGVGLEDSGAALKWTEAEPLCEGAPILIPAALCYRNVQDAHGGRPRVKLSSGCGAGMSREGALLHGLLELVERDAVALWWLGGRPGAPLPETGIPAALCRAIGREASSRISWLLDITTDLGIPCVAALSTNADGSGLTGGFSARLSRAEAVRAAVFEMCQMEVGLDLLLMKCRQVGEGGLNEIDRNYLRRAFGFDVRNCPILFPSKEARQVEFEESASSAPLEDLAQALNGRGVRAWSVELTRPDLAIPAVRTIAPALQPYPSDLITPRLQRQLLQTGEGFGLTSGIQLM
jgi:ribosomal protein S12 methylthiotransferase accessory factor